MTGSAYNAATSDRSDIATDDRTQVDAGTADTYCGENLYISSTGNQVWTGSWSTEFVTADPASGQDDNSSVWIRTSQPSAANDNGDGFVFAGPDDHIPDGETLYIAPQFAIPDGETLFVAADQTGHPGATNMNSLFWDTALETPSQDAGQDDGYQVDWTEGDPLISHEAVHVLQRNESDLF